MKPGRKPTPTALRKLRGNPQKRALPRHEPEPGGLMSVQPPAHLSRDARAEWRRLADDLVGLKLLTVNDLAAFAAYCSAWGDLVAAERALRRGGLVVRGKEKQLVRSPWILVKARAIDQIIKLGDRFGLSPSARVGLASADIGGPSPARPGGQSGSSLAEYLRQKPDRLPGDDT